MMKKKTIKSNNEISELCSFSLGGYQQKVLMGSIIKGLLTVLQERCL